MKRVFYFPSLLLLSAFVFVGCSQTTESDEPNYPQIPNQKTETSIAENHPDTYAQMVRTNVESFTFFSSFVIQPSGSGWVKNGNTWSFSQTQNGAGYTYKLTENETSYSYQYILNGEIDDVTYVNFVAISGSVAKSGQTAEWKLFESEDGVSGWTVMDFDYFEHPTTKVKSIEYKSYSSENHEQVDFDYSASINPDKSGMYVYYLGGTALSEATWAANGSGSLKDYSGESTVTHEWTANP